MTELLKKVKQGDPAAREMFVEQNFGLVRSVVKRFTDREASEDLFQIGCIGLLKAIDRFDLSYGVCFSTYAFPYIIGEIKMYLRDDGLIKVSRSIRALGIVIRQEEENWRQEHQKEPKITEIAKKLNVSPAEAAMALAAIQSVDSLDRPITENASLGECIADTDEWENVLQNVVLQEEIRQLSDRERNLIMLRYFEKNTQSEVGKKLSLSQVQVSRLEKEILKKTL